MTRRTAITAGLLCAALWVLPGTGRAQDTPQVNVSVKIIEFQTSKELETGLSAYFKQRNEPRPYGRVSSGNGNITSAALTFPNATQTGLTVLLDKISNQYGDFEVILQALVDQNKAFILSQPKVLVPVPTTVPAVIKTTQEVPYENTIVIGASAVQTTAFRPTGVTLTVSALKVVDDDQNPLTTEDIFVQLKLTAEINEEGQRITVALDEATGSTSNLSKVSTAISVPEFVSRSVDTTVWVRNGQVLVLGGLFRNTKSKNLASLPWLTQGEGIVNNLAGRVLPSVSNPEIPLAAGLGNNDELQSRRELVFMVKADLWRKSYTVADEFGFMEEEEGGDAAAEGEAKKEEKPKSPTDVITGVLENLSGMSQGVAGSLSDKSQENISGSLGGSSK